MLQIPASYTGLYLQRGGEFETTGLLPLLMGVNAAP